ncbi:hypothetical protein RB620_22490 [Paenibacillus sp. LHD-117]|uniref:hypothetical protein n=1 Tax=Paenibacillus sp. LHD-117 TaxID=3071412 RepID=UPI0027DEDE1D|nr:hypothetical protein [Paenibacillus sp. LHD-117]MDQ6422202.1 hypothetical protein [Paenibacillus sp. LHD-117]
MKENQKNKWAKIRAKGKRNYIIVNGILGWGIPTAILFTLLTSYLDNDAIIFNKELMNSLFTSLIIFSIVGIPFGFWTWNWMERIYNKNNVE